MKFLQIPFFLILFLVSMVSHSQNFYGNAIYKTHRKMDGKIKVKGVNSAIKEKMAARLKKMFQKTYILHFNTKESTYKLDEELATPNSQIASGMKMVVMGGGDNSLLYKNVATQKISEKKDLLGKTFLIKDKLPKQEWVLTEETKNIGTYTCYKAYCEKEVENKKISMVNGEVKEEVVKETIKTVAWYTPSIPVSHGPGEFWGLPGLILEINEGKLTIVCTEISINPTEKQEIKEPKKGKIVSKEEFKNISDQKTKEMMERYSGKKGKGKGIQIKIGG